MNLAWQRQLCKCRRDVHFEKRKDPSVIPDSHRPGRGFVLECGSPASAGVFAARRPATWGRLVFPASLCSGHGDGVSHGQPHFLQAVWPVISVLATSPIPSLVLSGLSLGLYPVPCSAGHWLRPYSRPDRPPRTSHLRPPASLPGHH